MALKVDGLTLPPYANDGFREILKPNYTKVYSLSNKLSVDFEDTNIRRGWAYTFDVITAAEYASIRTKFNKQFTSRVFLRLEHDEASINLDCFMELPDDRNIKWSAGFVKDLTITFEPENADSI